MPPRIATAAFSCCLLAGASLAQNAVVAAEGSPEQSALIAAAIRDWVTDFEKGRLGPKGLLRRGADLQPSYVSAARRAGRIADVDVERITHLDALQKLLYHAERYPTVELGDAVLGVAAAGLESSFLDVGALEL